MHQILKPLLVTLALAGATTSLSISADTIRLTGPNGEVISAPQYSQPVRQLVNDESSAPSRYYGPTGQNETLWSIASRFKPAGASVQQTIYAFYELNPGQFEKGNIHQLLPGSELRIPSNALINRVDLQEALAVLAAHQNKLNQPASVVEAPPRPEPKKPQPKPTEVVTAPPVAKAEPTPAVETSPQLSTPEEPAEKIQAPDVTEALREELSRSESELLSLEERNHQLRLMLSEVQHEVEALKTEVDNEERIRTEVERQLSEEKRKQVEMARLAPSQLDVWLAKPWFVALLAFVPALLLGLLVMALLRSRKRRNDEPAKQQLTDSQTETTDKPDMAAAAGGGAAMAAAAVASEEDDLFSDDLLAGLDDETEQSDDEESDANNVFADLDEADFDFNLDDEDDPFASIDDDGELDIGVVDLDTSNNGISVKDGEKALGLEEMERALNDVAVPGDDEELDLNLSDEDTDSSNDVVSQDDLDSLFADFSLDTQGAAEESGVEGGLDEDSALNQAQMDELLAGDDFDLDEGEIDLDDLSADSPLASLEKLIAEEEESDAQESDDAATSFDTSLESTVSDSTVSESVDNDDIDDLFAQFSQIDGEPGNSIEPDTESDDVELLDDMLTDDFELSDLDDSDLTLDEMLSAEPSAVGDDDEVQLLADEETELDENSTELLDEVLFESSLSSSSDEPSEDDFDLDPFSADNLLGSEISDDEMDALFAANAPEPTASESLPEDITHDGPADTPKQDVSLEGATEVGASPLADGELDNEDVISSENTDLDDELLSGDELRLDDEPNLDDALQVDDAFDLSDETDILPDVQTDEVAAAVSDAELDAQQPELMASEALDTELEPLISDALDSEHLAFEDDIPSELNVEPESLASAQQDETFDAQAAGVEAATEPHTVDPQAAKSAESDIASNSEFEFVPEIEGGSQLSHEGDDSEQARKELDTLVANEFGVPSDDDWLVDEPVTDDAGPSSLDTLVETPDDEEDAEFLANALQSEYGEEQAFADAEGDNDDQPMSEDSSDSELTFADADLPEYSEEHAFADANLTQENVQPELTAEPASMLTSEETEQDLTLDSVTEPSANGTEEKNDSHASVDENTEPASLETSDAPLEDFEFPEFTEQDALLDLDESDVEPSTESMESPVHSAEFEEALSLESLPEYDEQQAAMDLEPMQEPAAATSEMIGETLDHSEIDALADAFSMVDMSAIEQEGNLDELLQDSGGATFSNISPVDQTTADSAGLDIDAMLQETSNSDAGEDWNGFTLTDEQRAAINNDIPDEEQAIWSGDDVGSLANASDEDWSSQDPVADFDGQEKSFMTIDELMAQVDDGDAADQEEEELKLDVGLDEFPDVIGPISEVDVDSDSEAAGNLDMAKIYIEMNDHQGAVKLLEKVLLEGSGQIEQEARRLLSKLSEHQ